jgi:hypothetical protein
MYVYSSIIPSNDDIKNISINEKGKKLNKDSILVSMCMYVCMYICIYISRISYQLYTF